MDRDKLELPVDPPLRSAARTAVLEQDAITEAYGRLRAKRPNATAATLSGAMSSVAFPAPAKLPPIASASEDLMPGYERGGRSNKRESGRPIRR